MKNLVLILLASFSLVQHSKSQDVVTFDTLGEHLFLGKQSPRFDIQTIDGRIYNSDKLTGKILVLNFWFIACGPCRRELPLLNELFALYKGNSVINFISISNIDSQEALRFVQKKLGIKYELVAKNQEMAEKFKVSLYPTNLIINRAGNIVFYEQGFHADIKDRMNSVINEVIK